MNRIKKYFFKRKIRFALNLLSSLDPLMKNAGFSRQECRQFWRNMAKDEDREKTIKYLGNKLEIFKK